MTTQAGLVGSGIQPLIDAIRASGADPGDLRAIVWQATWARGYEDVVAPLPALRLKEEGFVIYARPIGVDHYAAIIDTSHALWALVASGNAPPAGARVRVLPAFGRTEASWEVTVLETLGIGLTVRFGGRNGETHGWAEPVHDALERILDAEAERRKAIVAERRKYVAVDLVMPFREEIEALHEQLRVRIEAETAASPKERTAYERGNERQRKAIIEACKVRRVTRYHEEVKALRERIPELQTAYDRRVAANAEIRAAISELEDAALQSRCVTERVAIVEKHIAVIAASELLVTGDPERLEALETRDFDEIAQTVDLLHDLIPHRAQKR